jgi:hypothetical protein
MMDKENTIGVTLPTFVRVLMPNGRVEEMKLETYLAGVVALEIGANAPLEALKAQAVAARTYAAAAHRHPEHDADVCISGHCQKWKRVDPVVAPEVFRALTETWGMVAIFDGKLIDAFFFEHCDGHTRNSEDMLMPATAYLRGVDCSCGFLTLKGHGVGMCKRGAVVMARRGASFEQILRHYYRGVVVIHTAHEESAVEEPEPPPMEAVQAPPAPQPTPRIRTAPAPGGSPTAPRAGASPHVSATPGSGAPVKPSSAGSAQRVQKPTEAAAEAPPVAKPAQRVQKPIEADAAAEAARAPQPSPHVRKEAEPIAQPAPPQLSKNGSEKRVTRKPSRPKTRPRVPAEQPRAPASNRIETPPAETKPAAAAKPAEVTITVDSAHKAPAPFKPAQPRIGKLRDVIVGEVVKSEETAAPPQPKPTKPPRRVHIDHLPGQRMIAGSLPQSGMTILIEDGHGNKTVVQSGSAGHYGEGGFELMVEEDGRYLVTIDDQVIEVQVDGETVFIHAI